MDHKEIDAQIGEAWRSHYTGQNEVAIEKFSQILSETPDHIDANWGIGLAYRKSGEKEKALQAFQKVIDLISEVLDASPEDRERFFMLRRMAQQQIDYIGKFI